MFCQIQHLALLYHTIYQQNQIAIGTPSWHDSPVCLRKLIKNEIMKFDLFLFRRFDSVNKYVNDPNVRLEFYDSDEIKVSKKIVSVLKFKMVTKIILDVKLFLFKSTIYYPKSLIFVPWALLCWVYKSTSTTFSHLVSWTYNVYHREAVICDSDVEGTMYNEVEKRKQIVASQTAHTKPFHCFCRERLAKLTQ